MIPCNINYYTYKNDMTDFWTQVWISGHVISGNTVQYTFITETDEDNSILWQNCVITAKIFISMLQLMPHDKNLYRNYDCKDWD
jgi:hypothetical protein